VKVLIIEDDRQVVKDVSLCLGIRYPDVVVVPVTEGPKGIEFIC